MSTSGKPKSQEDLYRQKAARRRASAAKPVEEKLEMLIKLQQIASTVAREAGRPYKQPWNIKAPKQP